MGWIKPLIYIFMDGVADTVDFQAEQLYTVWGQPDDYVRIEERIGTAASDDMDDASKENVRELVNFADEAVAANRDKLQAVAAWCA